VIHVKRVFRWTIVTSPLITSSLSVLQRGWTVSGDNVFTFHREAKKSDDNLHSEELAVQAIEYARELEMIV